MKQLPQLLIMGRPNVGKSTLINRILGQKRAITSDVSGVTRDIVAYHATWRDRAFFALDSGGVLFDQSDDIYLQNQIDARVKRAIDEADVILMITDAKAGLNPLDLQVAKYLHGVKEKVVLGVNKVDNDAFVDHMSEFYRLGLGDPHPLSATHNRGIDVLLDFILDRMTKPSKVFRLDDGYRVAVVGRPNVGKSSLVNALLNEDRMIVDDRAGTTRDSADAFFTYNKQKYIFTDTAGLRKKSKIQDDIEFYSTVRSEKSILKSDVVVIVLDAIDFMTDQDKKIIRKVLDASKNMIVFVNKWDLTDRSDEARQGLIRHAQAFFPSLVNFPILFGSAKDRVHLDRLFTYIPEVIASGNRRIATAELNRFFDHVLKHFPPPKKGGSVLKVFYGTQTHVNPPTFVIFVNDMKRATAAYERFIEGQIRQAFGGFLGNPVKVFFKNKSQKRNQ